MRFAVDIVRPAVRAALAAAILALLFALPSSTGHAARDWFSLNGSTGSIARDTTRQSGMELLVFEVEGCTYCGVFRRDVLPLYQSGTQAGVAPIRFVDLARVEQSQIGLRQPVSIVPTFVLMKDGREVDRIAGLTARETFTQLVSLLIQRAD